jgi:hypothetical protein
MLVLLMRGIIKRKRKKVNTINYDKRGKEEQIRIKQMQGHAHSGRSNNRGHT